MYVYIVAYTTDLYVYTVYGLEDNNSRDRVLMSYTSRNFTAVDGQAFVYALYAIGHSYSAFLTVFRRHVFFCAYTGL